MMAWGLVTICSVVRRSVVYFKSWGLFLRAMPKSLIFMRAFSPYRKIASRLWFVNGLVVYFIYY